MLGQLQAVQKSNGVCVHTKAAKCAVFISLRLKTVLEYIVTAKVTVSANNFTPA
jgi:hypothetical protein